MDSIITKTSGNIAYLDKTNIDLPLRQLAMKGVSDRIPLQSDPLAASQSLKTFTE
jgi:hypothetical protein